MVIAKAGRLALLLLGCAGLVACAGIDWEEVAAAQEREIASIEAWAKTVEPILRPPSGNAGSEAWVAYQVRMASVALLLEGMKPDTLRTVLAYAAERQQIPLEIVDRVLAGLQVAGTYGLLPGQSSGSSTSLKFEAKDGGSFDNFDFTVGNKAPFVAGSDNATPIDDGQIQQGDGTQGQVITRPITQPNPATEGGDINNDSTGVTGTGDIGL